MSEPTGAAPVESYALGEGLRVALESVRANRVRSLLTILGLSVGVGVVMLLAAFITGLRTAIQDSFEASGPNNFVVSRFDFTAAQEEGAEVRPWWMNPALLPEEASRLGRLPGVEEALYNVPFTSTIDFESVRLPSVESSGYDAGWPAYTQGDFVAGRNFTPAEVRESRPVEIGRAHV